MNAHDEALKAFDTLFHPVGERIASDYWVKTGNNLTNENIALLTQALFIKAFSEGKTVRIVDNTIEYVDFVK